MEEKIQISFDSTDLAGMIKIMDEHGDIYGKESGSGGHHHLGVQG